MLTRLKSIQLILIAALLVSVVVPECVAQGVRPCKHGNCGSPLAGSCGPASPYGYVPTSWRRWPTDHGIASKAPEELPTPAAHPEREQMPVPQEPSLPIPREPSGTAPALPTDTTDRSPAPPFGDAPTPSFDDEPPAFGDEPQAPPSAADPLAVPFGDEPPSPPDDIPSGSVPARESLPTEPQDRQPTMPDEDLFKDDPFQDEPEPKTSQAPEPGSPPSEIYSAGRARNSAARNERGTSAIQLHASANLGAAPTSEPRLLQANGESLTPARLPEPVMEGDNPLRQVSHPVRKTVYGASAAIPAAESPAAVPTPVKSVQWRHNPLRGN